MLYQLSYSRFLIKKSTYLKNPGTSTTRYLAGKSMVEGGGFEPPKATPTDLQSVPFDHSGTPPLNQNRHARKTCRSKALQNNNQQLTQQKIWSWRWDLNPQPADYKSAALPIELRQRNEPGILIKTQLNINHFFQPGKCLIQQAKSPTRSGQLAT